MRRIAGAIPNLASDSWLRLTATGNGPDNGTRRHLRHRERSHNGGTVSLGTAGHLIGQKPVDPSAAAALRVLGEDLGLPLILASNTLPCETRWPALQQAGIAGLFRAALLSYPLGVRKPDPLFYDLVLAAAGYPARQVPRVMRMAAALTWARLPGREAPVSGRGCGPGLEAGG